VGTKSRQKRRRRAPLRATATPAPVVRSANAVHAQIPKPRVTSYTTTTAVPVFQHGEAGPHRGSPGVYDVVLILGIPGVGEHE